MYLNGFLSWYPPKYLHMHRFHSFSRTLEETSRGKSRPIFHVVHRLLVKIGCQRGQNLCFDLGIFLVSVQKALIVFSSWVVSLRPLEMIKGTMMGFTTPKNFRPYCSWKKSCTTFIDSSSPLFTGCFTSQVVGLGISSINSIAVMKHDEHVKHVFIMTCIHLGGLKNSWKTTVFLGHHLMIVVLAGGGVWALGLGPFSHGWYLLVES